jgi:hypothetical protein
MCGFLGRGVTSFLQLLQVTWCLEEGLFRCCCISVMQGVWLLQQQPAVR